MDKTVVRGCYFKGFVESRDAYASWFEAESDLRDQAVNEGGNVVLLLSQAGTGDLHEHSGGEALLPGAEFHAAARKLRLRITDAFLHPDRALLPTAHRLSLRHPFRRRVA